MTSGSRPQEGESEGLSPWEGVSRGPARLPLGSRRSEHGHWSRGSRRKAPGHPCPSWFCVLGQLTRPGAVAGLWGHGVPPASPFEGPESSGAFGNVCKRTRVRAPTVSRLLRPHRAARRGSARYTRSNSARCPSWVSGPRRVRPSVRPGRLPVRTPRVVRGPCPRGHASLGHSRVPPTHTRSPACTCTQQTRVCARVSTRVHLHDRAPSFVGAEPSAPLPRAP